MKTFAEIVEKHGGKRIVANMFEVSRAAVWKWCRNNRVPARKAAQIAATFDLDPHLLRPDIFPPSPTPGEQK